MAGSGDFEAVISGKGGHAAIPQHLIDPILTASNVIISLQHLVSREADPLDSQQFNLHCALYGCKIPWRRCIQCYSRFCRHRWHIPNILKGNTYAAQEAN